jgi:hypothetical protein
VPSATFGKVGAEEESAWKLSRGGRRGGSCGSGRRGGRRGGRGGVVGGVVGPERAGLQVEESVLLYVSRSTP